MSRSRWLTSARALRVHALLFAVGLVAFAAVAGSRLGRQSSDPHFVYLADAWLHGQIAIDPPPARGDDWATLETVELRDGRTVRGRRLATRKTFRIAGGGEVPSSEIASSRGKTYHVSFPPAPALLMLPAAALRGRAGNDVWPTVLVAALCLPLCYATLRRLAAAGASPRRPAEDLWLTACLCFGTVFFFSAVQGRVWFTAHVVGVALALVYAWASIEARRPIIAGVALGLAALTRAPMAFMLPLFALEAWRIAGGDRRRLVALAIRFAVPVLVLAIAGALYNHVRFAEPGEFGHSYLAVRQQKQMETLGLFSYEYLGRNLAVAFTLLPSLSTAPPHVVISGHGLAMWLTTPVLLYLLWPRQRGPLHRALWLTVAAVAVPGLFYQNSGWLQFGYRFALDYLPFLVLLLAVGGRPQTRLFRALVVVAIAINLFGAITFARHWRFYKTDARTYDVVVAH
jgi:hypothetical protein